MGSFDLERRGTKRRFVAVATHLASRSAREAASLLKLRGQPYRMMHAGADRSNGQRDRGWRCPKPIARQSHRRPHRRQGRLRRRSHRAQAPPVSTSLQEKELKENSGPGGRSFAGLGSTNCPGGLSRTLSRVIRKEANCLEIFDTHRTSTYDAPYCHKDCCCRELSSAPPATPGE
jgi:hypothetical protein